jgi:hypothetical protein
MDSSKVNLMTSYNLAVSFTPRLFDRSNSVAGDDSMRIVEEMISGFGSIFKPEWTSAKDIMTDEDIEIIPYLTNRCVIRIESSHSYRIPVMTHRRYYTNRSPRDDHHLFQGINADPWFYLLSLRIKNVVVLRNQ